MDSFLLGCVGKPSAGKSSFLNASTDANAKVGNYPFTTIEPNVGVTHFQSPCPCAKYGKIELCNPRYGKCVNGVRYIPVKMLDVAGLVPGASEGRGLGNKFLDNLRTAHVLLHIIDVSGRTNEKGEETRGYDPINDAEWLIDEVNSWVFNNLWGRWGTIVRRHTATKSSLAVTLQGQFSGYGANMAVIVKTIEALGVKEPVEIEKWDQAMVKKLVSTFVQTRFPTVLVLNKIDLPESDGNVSKLFKKYDKTNRLVPCSALAEIFLRKLTKDGFVRYVEGADTFETSEDEQTNETPEKPKLKPIDDKLKAKLERIRDLILLRYNSTGVQDAIKDAVTMAGLVPVYPVKNIHNFTSDGKGVFRDCYLVRKGTTVREFCKYLSSDMDRHYLYAEGVSGQRLGEDEEITEKDNIIKFTTTALQTVVDDAFKKPSEKKAVSSTKSGKQEKDAKDDD